MKKFVLCLLLLCGVSVSSSATNVKFQFYGTDLCVKAKKKGLPQIERFDIVNVSGAIDAIVKKHIFDATIQDCQALKEQLQLNDWGYFVMLEEFSKCYAKTYTKSPELSTLIMAYICSGSGYDIRLGLTPDNQIVLLYATEGFVYNANYFIDDGKVFFHYKRGKGKNERQIKSVSMKNLYKGEKKLDFTLRYPPLLDRNMVEGQRHKSIFVKWDITVKVNKNLIDFYNDYPLYNVAKSKGSITKYTNFAEVSLSEEVKAQLYPSIKELISGHDQLTSVNHLLSWIQYGFEYQMDEKVWGYDRLFFSEESLYYQYVDSEDRAILFARLVTDLLGLKTICLYSSKINHVTIGVHFTDQEVEGESYIYNGEKYIICDPTYYGAGAGKVVNKWVTTYVAPIML